MDPYHVYTCVLGIWWLFTPEALAGLASVNIVSLEDLNYVAACISADIVFEDEALRATWEREYSGVRLKITRQKLMVHVDIDNPGNESKPT